MYGDHEYGFGNSRPESFTKLPPLLKETAVANQGNLGVEAFAELVVDSIQDIKGKKIVRIDLREVEDSPADFFIVCEGDSLVQVRAIAENVRKRARDEFGERTSKVEGLQTGNWLCLDFFDTVVHVFNPDMRDFYDLESLWGDAPSTSYEDL